MQEPEVAFALLNGWEQGVQVSHRKPLSVQWELIRRFAPISSVLLQFLDHRSQSVELVAAACEQPSAFREGSSVPCSEAKWRSIETWCRSGRLLRQLGGKRTGKLSILAPNGIANEVLAIPLRPTIEDCHDTSVPVGAALFEIDCGRSLRDEQWTLLERWSPILWMLLERLVREKGTVASGMTSDSTLGAPDGRVRDDAKEAIVGSETGLRAVMERVQIVAPSDMPVLILGETGTGKEVVARAIHGRSPRHAAPFIRVNCGAIPTELIDSQLFGHERGSFTGASDQHKGWFERADGGTLFLDEIGELPLAAQVRLLRVLQEHQFERVGGQEHIHVDVRIVAATHRDLSAMVHRRAFREDLWYRINIFPILLPGLRERIEDIPALAKHFAKRAANRFGLPYVEPSLADIKRLMDYRWPGNIRELQAVIDRAVILGGGSTLEVALSLGNAFLEPSVRFSSSDEPTFYEVIPESPAPKSVSMSPSSSVEDAAPIDSLDAAIVRHIERALAATNGQIEGLRGAAHLLGINPHTLRAKMRKLSIEWNRYRR